MPSWQPKFARKRSEMYSMLGPNHILIRMGWRTFPWSRKCLSEFFKQIQIITGSVKTKKSCVSWKMFKMEFKFSKLVEIIVLSCLQVNKTIGCSEYSVRYV